MYLTQKMGADFYFQKRFNDVRIETVAERRRRHDAEQWARHITDEPDRPALERRPANAGNGAYR